MTKYQAINLKIQILETMIIAIKGNMADLTEYQYKTLDMIDAYTEGYEEDEMKIAVSGDNKD